METELLQSTSLKSGTKAHHHAQNMLRITLLCHAQLVPFAQKKIAEITRKKRPHLTGMHELSRDKKKPSHLTFLMTDLMLFKKLDRLSLLKTRRA